MGNKTTPTQPISKRFRVSKRAKGRPGVFRFIVIGLALLLLAIFVYIVVPRDKRSEAIVEVRITSNGFEPAALIVEKGSKVIWINSDESAHQIAANPYPTSEDLPSLVSGILNNEQNYTYVFKETGTFSYHDKLNPTVNGVIEVRDR